MIGHASDFEAAAFLISNDASDVCPESLLYVRGDQRGALASAEDHMVIELCV